MARIDVLIYLKNHKQKFIYVMNLDDHANDDHD